MDVSQLNRMRMVEFPGGRQGGAASPARSPENNVGLRFFKPRICKILYQEADGGVTPFEWNIEIFSIFVAIKPDIFKVTSGHSEAILAATKSDFLRDIWTF